MEHRPLDANWLPGSDGDYVGYGGHRDPDEEHPYYEPEMAWSDLTDAGIPLPPESLRHTITAYDDDDEPVPAHSLTTGFPHDEVAGLGCEVCESYVNLLYQSPGDWSAACPHNQRIIRAMLAVWPVAYAHGVLAAQDSDEGLLDAARAAVPQQWR